MICDSKAIRHCVVWTLKPSQSSKAFVAVGWCHSIIIPSNMLREVNKLASISKSANSSFHH